MRDGCDDCRLKRDERSICGTILGYFGIRRPHFVERWEDYERSVKVTKPGIF
jgi:hypothetical protein